MSTFSYNIASNNNTMETSDKENKYIRARERVEELKKFYGNLTSYVLVISGLALINYFTNHFAYAWFCGPLLVGVSVSFFMLSKPLT